jgi:thiamine-phosphate pyrophosphorylase
VPRPSPSELADLSERSDLPERSDLAGRRLYLCVDSRSAQGDLAEFLDAVLAHGVDIVQLREKGLEALDELAALEVFADACRRHGALLAVNDRADIAVAAGADVLHLGQRDLPVGAARGLVGAGVLIGRSSHDAQQAAAAAIQPGVDYFCVGPCWPTPTKPGRPAAGLGVVREVAAAQLAAAQLAAAQLAGVQPPGGKRPGERPWFAIGGIDETNLDEVLAAGASRVVVVRAITQADDPGAAAARLAERLRDHASLRFAPAG